MTSTFTSRLASWLRLPLKRKAVAYGCENDCVRVKRKRFDKNNSTKTLTVREETILPSQKRLFLFREANREDHGMGWLINLPTELLYMIYEYLDNDALVLFSSMSKHLNATVLNYLLSARGFTRLLKEKLTSFKDKLKLQAFVDSKPFQVTGQLFGSVSACYSITKRLRLSVVLKQKLEAALSSITNSSVGSVTNCVCFGQFFSSYVSNWSELEKKKAFCAFEKATKLKQKIKMVLQFSPGTLPWHEGNLRQILCHSLLSSSSDQEYGFWLTQILRPYPLTHQARLLFILSGPTDHVGFVNWTSTCGCVKSLATGQNTQEHLFELARAFRILLARRSEWSMDTIISIFDELTIIPCGWALEKVASLLVNSGDELCKAIIGNRATNGHIEDLSSMLYYMANCCFTDDKNKHSTDGNLSAWYIDLLSYTAGLLSDKKEQETFKEMFFDMWHDYLAELFVEQPDSSDEDAVAAQFDNSISCLKQFTHVLLNKVLKSK